MNKWSVIVVILFLSCKHQPDVLPSIQPHSCDTTNVSYAADIKPVLMQYCFSCHAGSAAINGFDFAVFDYVQSLALDPYHYIPNVIDTTSHLRMPPAGYPIPGSCDINKMRAWVNRGALNN